MVLKIQKILKTDLFVNTAQQTKLATINLEGPKTFFAQINITMFDPKSSVGKPNAVAADIFAVDFRKFRWLSGGDHWGDAGNDTNHNFGTLLGSGSEVTFRLRAFPLLDGNLSATAEAMVMVYKEE